jgi:HK97 gp10 family phage protein
MRLEVKGINKAIKELKNTGLQVSDKVDAITKSNAQEIEAEAKQKAPVDDGFLRNQISTEKKEEALYGVVANAPYSAYMEFGTGGEVEVPNELKDIAIQFKGKGIKTVNIRPRPFLYPSFIKGRIQYLKDLKSYLKSLTK